MILADAGINPEKIKRENLQFGKIFLFFFNCSDLILFERIFFFSFEGQPFNKEKLKKSRSKI